MRLSFIPNTSELAFLGLAKQAQDHLDGQKAEIFKALKSNNGSAPKLSDAQLQELLTAKVRTEKVVHKDAKIRTFIQEDVWLWISMGPSNRIQTCTSMYHAHIQNLQNSDEHIRAQHVYRSMLSMCERGRSYGNDVEITWKYTLLCTILQVIRDDVH